MIFPNHVFFVQNLNNRHRRLEPYPNSARKSATEKKAFLLARGSLSKYYSFRLNFFSVAFLYENIHSDIISKRLESL